MHINYNIKNLTGKKVAIECSTWEERDAVLLIIKLPNIAVLDTWCETTAFICVIPGSNVIAWRAHYFAKNAGFLIISASDFIRDNSLEPEATQSIEHHCDSTVQQQDYIITITIERGPVNVYVAKCGSDSAIGRNKEEALGKLIQFISPKLKLKILQS